MIIVCSNCHREYEYNIKNRKGHTKTNCNSCLVKIRRKEIKRLAVEYKGGRCSVCGYDKCITALEFHHRDEREKSFSISTNSNIIKWETMRLELDKCDLVCANCHRELEFEKDNS